MAQAGGEEVPKNGDAQSLAMTPGHTSTATGSTLSSKGLAEEQSSLKQYSGAATEKVKACVERNDVVVFGKTWCPFCTEACNTLNANNVRYKLYNLDKIEDGANIHNGLTLLYQQTTVPYIFINKEFIGGCEQLKALQSKPGALDAKLSQVGMGTPMALPMAISDTAVAKDRGRAPGTLFAFPEVADDRVVRLSSLWSFIICVLVAVFHRNDAAHYVMLGLMVDYVLRLVAGTAVSPLASLSVLVTSILDLFGSKPKWMAGPAKQFAALCGLMFSALATLFYLLERYNDKLPVVGLAFTCALGAAAALEAFIGFCLGCYIFGLGIRIGLIPSNIYSVFVNTKVEQENTWTYNNEQNDSSVPEERVMPVDVEHGSQMDLKYKVKSDEYILRNFHILKYTSISHFTMHLGLVGLASAWKYAQPYSVLGAPTQVYYAIALGSGAWFVAWVCLYCLKCLCYPRKVRKEWFHPVHGNSFVLPFAICVLGAFLVEAHSNPFAKVLFWIGAPANLAISLFKVSEWISMRKSLDQFNASWIILPVSNFIAAAVGPLLDPKYRDACQFWFAYAFVMWMLLFSMSFYKAVVVKEEDDRMRSMLATWVAAPAMMGVAYMSCYVGSAEVLAAAAADGGVFNDFIFINLNWISVAVALVFIGCFWRPYFGRIKFDMTYWAAAFSADALAFVTLTYHEVKPGKLSGGISIAALAAASAINATLLLHTLANILKRRVFVPDFKWGPLSFMRLTHNAFREVFPYLMASAKAAAKGDLSYANITRIQSLWRMISLLHTEHSRHESDCIYPVFDEMVPGMTDTAEKQHTQHAEEVAKIDQLVTQVASSKSPETAVKMAKAMKAYTTNMEAHLLHEEQEVAAMPRKMVNTELAKQTVRKCWEATATAKWFELLPFIVNYQPMLPQRVRFLKTLLWAMPERAQVFGTMLAQGVDAVQWKRITDELPELIPRGVQGWSRYY